MFDYKAFLAERSDREITVAVVLRARADHGYLGERATQVLSETTAELASEPFPGEAGMRQLYLHFNGQQLVTRFKINRETGVVTFRDSWMNDEESHVDDMDMINYWYPTYFPDGKVSDRVAAWYAVADEKLNYKA